MCIRDRHRPRDYHSDPRARPARAASACSRAVDRGVCRLPSSAAARARLEGFRVGPGSDVQDVLEPAALRTITWPGGGARPGGGSGAPVRAQHRRLRPGGPAGQRGPLQR
eukprot:3854699-Prymnesium_polylepis.1